MRSLFGIPILGDKVTKKQRKVLRSNKLSNMFSDWDKDGVINGLDCQPRNKKRHSDMTDRQQLSQGIYKQPGDYGTQSQSLDSATKFFKQDEIHKYVLNRPDKYRINDKNIFTKND